MKKAAPLPPPTSGAGTPLDAVIAAMQRSMETALGEQREHGRLLREIVADTTQALLAEPPLPADLASRVAASVDEIKRLTRGHRQRAAALAASVQGQVEAMRTRATVAARPAARGKKMSPATASSRSRGGNKTP